VIWNKRGSSKSRPFPASAGPPRQMKSPGQTGTGAKFSRQRGFRARAIAPACHASVKSTFSNEKSDSGHQLAICYRLTGMTADECRQRAEEASRLAADTHDLWEREILFKIASQWQLLEVHRAVESGQLF
jgi:hypothetical protein